jgi:hypothetical protein
VLDAFELASAGAAPDASPQVTASRATGTRIVMFQSVRHACAPGATKKLVRMPGRRASPRIAGGFPDIVEDFARA